MSRRVVRNGDPRVDFYMTVGEADYHKSRLWHSSYITEFSRKSWISFSKISNAMTLGEDVRRRK